MMKKRRWMYLAAAAWMAVACADQSRMVLPALAAEAQEHKNKDDGMQTDTTADISGERQKAKDPAAGSGTLAGSDGYDKKPEASGSEKAAGNYAKNSPGEDKNPSIAAGASGQNQPAGNPNSAASEVSSVQSSPDSSQTPSASGGTPAQSPSGGSQTPSASEGNAAQSPSSGAQTPSTSEGTSGQSQSGGSQTPSEPDGTSAQNPSGGSQAPSEPDGTSAQNPSGDSHTPSVPAGNASQSSSTGAQTPSAPDGTSAQNPSGGSQTPSVPNGNAAQSPSGGSQNPSTSGENPVQTPSAGNQNPVQTPPTQDPEPGTSPGAPSSETPIPSADPPATEPVTDPPSTEPITSTPSPDPGTKTGKVHLGIDNRHIYSGMKQSFADGYEPEVTVSSATLVIPFTASDKLKDDTLTVDLEFTEKTSAPFQFKNYQKDVEKKTYYFDKTGTYTKDKAKAKDSGEAYLYSCKILLLTDAAPGQYPVTVKASGFTEKGEKVTLDYRLYIRIPEKTDDDVLVIDPGDSDSISAGGGGYVGGYGGSETEAVIHQPKMLLESCSLYGKALEAGTKEDMEISFKNRSDVQAMYNLKITLSTQASGLKLAKNSYYFSKVSPGEEIFVENSLEVAKDAMAADVPLTFTFEYEDSKGTPSMGSEQMDLTITQPVRMELEAGDLPTVLYASDTVELSMKALNLSRTAVYNVRVSLSGTGLFPREELFLGNLEAGTSGEDTMRIYVGTRTMDAIGSDSGTDDAEKYGPVNGTITLSYEDALGNPYEITKEYETEIKKAQILSLKAPEEQPEANSWWYSVFAVLIAAMVLLILLLLWRLRRKSVLLKEAKGESR